MILFDIPDIETLRSAVLASTTLHKVYIPGRERIFSAVLLQKLGYKVLYNAVIALHASNVPVPDMAGTTIKGCLSQYHSTIEKVQGSGLKISFSVAVSIGRLHSIVRSLVLDFYSSATSARPRLAELRSKLQDRLRLNCVASAVHSIELRYFADCLPSKILLTSTTH